MFGARVGQGLRYSLILFPPLNNCHEGTSGYSSELVVAVY